MEKQHQNYYSKSQISSKLDSIKSQSNEIRSVSNNYHQKLVISINQIFLKILNKDY